MRLTYGLTSALASVWLLTAGCGGQTSETDNTTEDSTSQDDATSDDLVKDDVSSDGNEPGSDDNAEDVEDDVADDTGDDATGTDDVLDVTGTDIADDTPTDDDPRNDVVETPSGPRASPPVDLLFVIDNSRLMASKQELFALAIPELVERLLAPVCIDESGNHVPSDPNETCAAGSQHEFAAITNLHVGMITTSLGGYGAQLDCTGDTSFNADALQQIDMAELLGSLPRGAAVSPSSATKGFLSWTAATDGASTATELTNLVTAAGEFGCGFEAPLEAWYRFLVEPYPYTKIVRQACNSSDTASSCAGPESMAGTASQLVNLRILEQRAAFLRPDSVLAVILFGDENDCSFKAGGQTWRLAQSAAADENGAINYYPAFRGTAACNNPEMGPNHQCCHSCGQATTPDGCPTMPEAASGQAVPVGCEGGRKFTIDEIGDNPNLRCFEQKRRFGVDYLYPVERYSTALLAQQLCPLTDTLAVDGCAIEPVPNPLYADLSADPNAGETPKPPRPAEDVFLVGVVGVPWQDLVVDPTGDSLKYRVARSDAVDAERINWDWIIGPRDTGSGIPAPLDPLMKESVQPREGMVPSTGESLAPPGAAFGANSSNGHEFNVIDESQLQYACIFPVPERACLSVEETVMRQGEGESVPPCQCTDTPGDEWSNPLCQAPDGTFDGTERAAGAFPGLRQLQVLHDVGDHAVVTSICPWNVDSTSSGNYGYRPAMNALVERLRERLQ